MSIEEEATSERARIYVPNPATALNVGLAFAGEDDYETAATDGITVNTAEHIRVYANGTSGNNDLVAQATGKLWMQAVDDVVVRSKRKLMVASAASSVFTAAKGVHILAGFGQTSVSSDNDPGVLPQAVEDYADKADLAASIWAGFNASTLAVAGVLRGVESLVGNKFQWNAGAVAATAIAGTTLNALALKDRDVDLPGINLFSNAGIYVGAVMGSVNIAGLGGVYLGSLYTAVTSILSTTIRGVFRSSLMAGGAVDISAIKGYEGKTDGDHSIYARTGTLLAAGTKIRCGISGAKAKLPQLPTKTVLFSGLKEVIVESIGSISAEGMLIDSKAKMATNFKSTKETSFKAGTWEVSITPKDITVGLPHTASMKIDASGVTIAGPSKVSTVKLGPSRVELKSGSGSLAVVPGTSVQFSGLEFAFK